MDVVVRLNQLQVHGTSDYQKIGHYHEESSKNEE